MARIRSVHPGLWTDEQFVSLSMPARLLFIGIWNEADDRGAFEWKPLTLKMRLMAADDVDVSALLEELEHARVVSSYEVEGKRYGLVRNFTKFQRPKKPTYVHPVPGDAPTSSPPVPHQPETAPEKSPQMEEEGEGVGKEEGKEGSDPNGSVVAAKADDAPEVACQCGGEDDPFEIPEALDRRPARSSPLPIQKAFDNYNIAAEELGLPQAQTLTDGRRKGIGARLREHGIEGWNRALLELEDSEFCQGKNGRGWRADLDFLLQPKSFNRLLEGAYRTENAA